MIIDFTVDGKDLLAIRRVQWLSATFRIDDGKTFVSQDGTAAYINTTPVRSAMTDFLRHSKRFVSQFLGLRFDIEDTYDSTHDI